MKTVKKDPPDYKSILKFLAQNPSAIPSAFGVAVDEAKRRLAENISPVGYIGAKDRIYNALVLNEPQEGSYQDKTFNPSDANKERMDLFSMYLGRKQPYNSILPSEYGSEETPLYRSPATEKSIEQMIKDAYAGYRYVTTPSGFPTFRQETSDSPLNILKEEFKNPSYHYTPVEGEQDGYLTHGNVLGNYTGRVKQDEKGTYIEYEDVWDLNPFSGSLSVKESREKGDMVRFLEGIGEKAIGATPAKIYGRIYFDPETGKIQENK